MEKTLVLLKPDAVSRQVTGEIIQRFEKKGIKIAGMKMMRATKELLQEHYKEHEGKPFLPGLINFMNSNPIIAMVMECNNAVEQVRKMCGATNASKAEPGTIRGDYGQGNNNLIHASDSQEAAAREINIFFKPEEIHEYTLPNHEWVYAKDERQ